MRIDVVTIFPSYLEPLREALLGRAIERGLLEVAVHDLRHWTHDVHQAVDDAPYGGGPGMVMRPQVWGDALDEVLGGAAPEAPAPEAPAPEAPAPDDAAPDDAVPDDAAPARPPARLVVPTPAGRPFTQATARSWATEPRLVFACGRYEGIDERVLLDVRSRGVEVDEVSIGDYVLVGGEVAVLVMVEAVVRLIPGVLGNPRSAAEDSFSDGLLEGPSYTRPETWRGLAVPEVLRSGNHAAIDRWRRDRALQRTRDRRPDLIDALPDGALDAADRTALAAGRTDGEG
ncbi:tRNA (guanosine(37)-N1)-methyltransferase TrmD [Pseudonocardia nematodicida]|uniref:tRNA (guanine-N(1)-)-methyltransferase n=1 Tax=Pseudonocardia nematodicida TaxID=1206997 RepID=A0ABV1KK63_9PSEU